MIECDLCGFTTQYKRNFIVHCNGTKHISNEIKELKCILCNKSYKNERSFRVHKKEQHLDKNTKKYKNNDDHDLLNDNSSNDGNLVDKINSNINSNITKVKHEINKVGNKVEKVGSRVAKVGDKVEKVENNVNKALTKASSLIKYLMEHFSHVPSLQKIKEKDCIHKLRIDYDCIDEETDYKYELELVMIDDHYRGKFVKNIAKTILDIVNHKNPKNQPIYNTDANRYNYVIKIKTKWNEDMSGVKFTELIIKPILIAIEKLIHSYRVNRLENINMYKNNLEQNIEHMDLMSRTLNFELSLHNEYLIKPILKELAPHLRFIEYELNEIDNILSEFDTESDTESDTEFTYIDDFIKMTKKII